MKTQKQRRKKFKTDYGKRLKILKGRKPRIVLRKTNKYIIVQYVGSKEAKDKVILGLTSKKLLNYGWPKKFQGSLKSIPASYLIGFLIGKKIVNEKLEMPIVDFGMIKNVHKTRIYACLKGLIDAEIKLKFNKEKSLFPDENSIEGKNLKNDFSSEFKKIKLKIEQEK